MSGAIKPRCAGCGQFMTLGDWYLQYQHGSLTGTALAPPRGYVGLCHLAIECQHAYAKRRYA